MGVKFVLNALYSPYRGDHLNDHTTTCASYPSYPSYQSKIPTFDNMCNWCQSAFVCVDMFLVQTDLTFARLTL